MDKIYIVFCLISFFEFSHTFDDLARWYMASFPRAAIDEFREVICSVEAHVIHIYYDDTIQNSYTSGHVLRYLMECKSAPVQVETFASALVSKQDQRKSRLTVFVLLMANNSEAALDFYTGVLVKKKERKHFRKFFVVFEEVGEGNPTKWLMHLFRIFWNKNIVNVVVAFFHQQNLQLFTFNPFTDNGFQLHNISVENISNEKRFFEKDMFFNKIMNLHKKTLNVTMDDEEQRACFRDNRYYGVDGELAVLMEER